MSDRIHPFSNGTQHMDWMEANCCHCAKDDGQGVGGGCEIGDAICSGSFGDGTVSMGIAKRMAYTDASNSWRCGEFEPRVAEECEPRNRRHH